MKVYNIQPFKRNFFLTKKSVSRNSTTSVFTENNEKQPFYKLSKKIYNLYSIATEKIFLTKYKLKMSPDNRNKISSANKQTKTLLSQRIKQYIEKRYGKEIDPAELDKRLTKISNGNFVEEPFSPKGNITMGRKKIFYMPSGKKIMLESHNYIDPKTGEETFVTRIYDIAKNKNYRDYLDNEGKFIHGIKGYKSINAHLSSGNNGLNWIKQAKQKAA